MLIKPVLPVLALLSIVGNGIVSAAESEVSSAKAFKDSAKASKVSSAKAAKSEGSETSSAKAFKDDGKASKLAKSEAAVVDAKAEKVGKASKSKVGKMFKSKKQGSKASGAAPSAPTTATPLGEDPSLYRSEFLDPSYWHPATSNFEIIDWERWEAACGRDRVPFTYDPPQRKTFSTENIFAPGPAQWGRLDNLPEEVIATGAKPSVGYVSSPDYGLFYGILGQAPDPTLVPEPFRNKLIWMQDNVGGEYLNSFNRAAWRHNTPEGRVTGLFLTGTDYTGATHETAFALAESKFKNQFVNFQVSPDGKWVKLFNIPADPNDTEIDSAWFDMYIVQEGDVFTDMDGNVLDWVKAGDIYRLTVEGRMDPYKCYDNHRYSYFMRIVATIDEETGVITPEYPHYDALIEAVTSEPPKELKEATNEWTDSSSMTQQEKFDLLTDYEPDRQMYLTSPLPPPAVMLDDL